MTKPSTKRRPVKFNDIRERAAEIEQRPHSVREGRSTMGRKQVYIYCPFCRSEILAYAWSLAGGGKRCDCGALHGTRGETYHWTDTR